jgi:methyl-accepting chemotaxis protein
MITRLMSLPIWVRVVGTLLLVVFGTVAGLTAWSSREQERLALMQAQQFAKGSVHAILPGMLAAMASGDPDDLAMFLDHLRESRGLHAVQVIPSSAVTQQYAGRAATVAKGGATASSRAAREPQEHRLADGAPADPLVQRVFGTGEAFYGVANRDGTVAYRAIVPITARRQFLGRDCLACHSVAEGAVLGAVSLEIGLEEVQRASRMFQRNVVLAAAILAAVLIWAAYLLSTRTITRPLRAVVAQMEHISAGQGDLTKRLPVTGGDEIGQLASRFNAFMDTIQHIVAEARASADHVASAAQQVSAASEQLSSGAQQQASSLEETAASLEEMTATVRQNADNARDASQLAAASREIAERGKTVVVQAVASMDHITRASRRIGEIIAVIDDIAFQTNLLALNAAVEAARAGEQGRGFAVVASEVRSLAQRSASAAKEIKALIADSVTKIDAGAALVNRSGETLEEIVTSVKRVSTIITEIAAASQEQSAGIDQVNRAVLQMDQVVQQNAAQTEELSSTSQSLANQAQQLQQLVRRFTLDVETSGSAMAVWSARPAVAVPVAVRPSRRSLAWRDPVLASPAVSTNGKTARHDGFEEF